MDHWATICEQSAKTGGKVLSEMLGKVTTSEKGKHDLLTEADLESQKVVTAVIQNAFPDHTIIGEEDPQQSRKDPPSGFVWLIDPLDGTTNYVHGFPHFCVSVALLENSAGKSKLLAATIFDPGRNECFSAAAGSGATLNGSPIRVSSSTQLGHSLLVASLPPVTTIDSIEIQTLLKAMTTARSVRRTGSAALNLAYLAAGRLDGYWATSLKPWDAAAGALLIQESGGKITGFDSSPFDAFHPRFVAASTDALHAELSTLVGDLN